MPSRNLKKRTPEQVAARAARRTPVIDLIWTQTGVGCCLATHMGWSYGIRSDSRPCANAGADTLHRVQFVDHNFRRYDHTKHLAAVAAHAPRYTTVRDAMTPEQCAALGTEYVPLECILDWADELAQHAANVIVVPKYDCLDRIPERFMLGYSIPTRYGGTLLPVEALPAAAAHLLPAPPAEPPVIVGWTPPQWKATLFADGWRAGTLIGVEEPAG